MILSGVAIAGAYVPFVVGTLRGPIVPNRATWLSWFVLDCLMAASGIASNIGPSVIMPIIWGVGAAIMLWLAFTKGSRDPFTILEKTCLVMSGVGILLWATVGSPRLAMIASVSACAIGGIPTLIKAWKQPWTESMAGWLLMITGSIFSSLAVEVWTFDSGFLPITMGVYQTIVTIPLVREWARTTRRSSL